MGWNVGQTPPRQKYISRRNEFWRRLADGAGTEPMKAPRPASEIRADIQSTESAITLLCRAPRDYGLKPDRTWRVATHAMIDRVAKLRAELDAALTAE